ncbi:MAG: 16S rRNA (cytosine(1402)-N(4))-methyltransferase RsmH [Chitinivibrionales bacterium]|nr:16S rRNA (cytosine(1402)-N(4))-methyltransferase RsmH [Chitinivibrionales bacterium]
MNTQRYHIPVLLKETTDALAIKPNGIYLDCTLGGGGHFLSLLNGLDSTGVAVGIDRDPDAVAWNRERFHDYAPTVIIEQERFSQFDRVLHKHHISFLDGMLLDLGLSQHHITEEQRGFSYMKNAPLDMRMDPTNPLTAADILNNSDSAELTRIFGEYGEIQNPQRMARTIAHYTNKNTLHTTDDLKECLHREYGPRLKIKMLAKLYQALRIAVNDELRELKTCLGKSVKYLNKDGRLVVMAYHSLEDRIVKNFMRDMEKSCTCPPGAIMCTCGNTPKFKRVNRKAIKASEQEIAANPSARPARLRAATRTGN